jgi:hypothetical protein
MDNAFERTPQAETQIPRSLLGVIPDRAGTIKSGPSCTGERPKSCNLIENRQVVEACFDRQSVRVAGWYGNNDVARRAMERTRHSICWNRSFTRAWIAGAHGAVAPRKGQAELSTRTRAGSRVPPPSQFLLRLLRPEIRSTSSRGFTGGKLPRQATC